MLVSGMALAESQGERLFNQKCIMCHIVNGKGGAIGPELTRTGAQMGAASIHSKIVAPKKTNPSTTMPSFNTLPKHEINAIVNYVSSLK